MKNSAKCNMYEVGLAQTRELFGDYLDGSPSALICAVSAQVLGEAARAALESSAAALGYGHGAVTFATLADAEGALDGPALFALVEGLDPLCVVAADAEAATALSQAYRQELPPMKAARLFGRPAVAFDSFEQMLADDQAKQRAWALLKTLPRL